MAKLIMAKSFVAESFVTKLDMASKSVAESIMAKVLIILSQIIKIRSLNHVLNSFLFGCTQILELAAKQFKNWSHFCKV